jgi:hypothetical protein
MGADIAISVTLILVGLFLVSNVGQKSERIHSIMRLAWNRMDQGWFDRAARIYVVFGTVPFWAFRLIAAVLFLGGGLLGLFSAIH